MLDYILASITKFVGMLMRLLPFRVALLLGRKAGELAYYLAPFKRNSQAYCNIKAALGNEKSPKEIRNIIRTIYRNLGEGFVELMWFPKFGKDYTDNNLRVEGMDNFYKAQGRGKGIIFLTAHYGNWEVLNLAAALKGYPIKAVARQQKMKRLDGLLNSYRQMKGCGVIFKDDATREVLRSLKDNQRVGILGDQAAKASGVFVDFFGRKASFAPGTFSFALKTGCAVLPTFIIRRGWGRHTIVQEPFIQLDDTGDKASDIKKGAEQYAEVLEAYIRKNPDHWLWLHRKWKATPSRKVLIISDGKAGHEKQSLALARILEESDRSKIFEKKIVRIKYKNKAARTLLNAVAVFSNKKCQGCMACLRHCLEPDSYKELIGSYADVIISCGSSTSPVNLVYSRETGARRASVMRPGIFSTRRFDLVVSPAHDKLRGKNVITTRLSLNLSDGGMLEEYSAKFARQLHLDGKKKIGLLIGGDNDTYKMDKGKLEQVLKALLGASEKLQADILATTSRRTRDDIEKLAKDILGGNKRCKLLVVANEKNMEGVVPGILGLSEAVIVSGESVSMLSEAVSSGKKVFVFGKPEKGKHRDIVEQLQGEGAIEVIEGGNIQKQIEDAFSRKAKTGFTDDSGRIKEAVSKII